MELPPISSSSYGVSPLGDEDPLKVEFDASIKTIQGEYIYLQDKMLNYIDHRSTKNYSSLTSYLKSVDKHVSALQSFINDHAGILSSDVEQSFAAFKTSFVALSGEITAKGSGEDLLDAWNNSNHALKTMATAW